MKIDEIFNFFKTHNSLTGFSGHGPSLYALRLFFFENCLGIILYCPNVNEIAK